MSYSLDLKSGYWQVEMENEVEENSVFYQHVVVAAYSNAIWPLRCPSYLRKADGNCSHRINIENLLSILERPYCHWKDVWRTSSKSGRAYLREYSTQLNSKKCQLFQEDMMYLGHVVSKERISVDLEKTVAVQEWPVAKDEHKLRCFLGPGSYYRRFVHGFANITKPLTNLTEKGRTFESVKKPLIVSK